MCFFLLQLSKFVIVLFAHSNERKDFSVGSLKFVIKELRLKGNLAPRGRCCQMGYDAPLYRV